MQFQFRHFGLSVVLVLSALLAVQCSDDKSTNSSHKPLVTNDTTIVLLADHTSVDSFDQLADSTFARIRSSYNFFYGHTSHGSQIITGLAMLESENALYESPIFYEYGDDLGTAGDTTWVPATRIYLAGHPDCNVVVWSWCGGCTGNSEAGIDAYLQAMSGLEEDYPDVTFIYMTGHLDGSGPSGSLYRSNNQIRAFCDEYDKVLFDFADIESYDPDGTYYPDETDACGWCSDWCSDHTCTTCGGCAHSHCFNCYRKGKAFWSLMAELYQRDH